MFPPAVVSADTDAAVLMNRSAVPTSTSISCIFVEATLFLCRKVYSRETVSLLYIWGTAGSSVWPVKAMLGGCDLHTYILKTCLHHRRRRSSTVISMPVHDSSSLHCCLKSSYIEKKAVNLERSPSLDKNPMRQSTHLKTLYELYHILHKSFGLWDTAVERLMGLSWISCGDVAATLMTSPRVWKNNYCAKPPRGKRGAF